MSALWPVARLGSTHRAPDLDDWVVEVAVAIPPELGVVSEDGSKPVKSVSQGFICK